MSGPFGSSQWMNSEDATPWCGSRGVFAGTTNVMDYVTIASPGNATDFGNLTVGRRLNGACSNGTKGFFGGGYPTTNVIDYVTIDTTGNAIDFGDLTVTRLYTSCCSDSTRAVWVGGDGANDIMDYVTMSTPGNASDFGNLTAGRQALSATSNNTTGVMGSGNEASSGTTASTIIDYITISSTGNATDFGDITVGREQITATAGD